VNFNTIKIKNLPFKMHYYSVSSDTESNISLISSTTDDETCPVVETITDKVTLEYCSVTYFAGYLAFKCHKKFNYNHCKNHLFTDKNLNEKRQLLLINENYSSFDRDTGLKAPLISFNKIINRVLEIVEKHFEKIQHRKKIRLN
jgi:hypothetical protein